MTTVIEPIADRARMIDAARAGALDVLVIGAGATGCGVARDIALRGRRVALVEEGDIANGTSSRSSRLIHGGVRYLEQGALGLVFEASAERRRLLRLAPHLVRPLEFLWPAYAGARVPPWKLRAGLALYDLLALFRNVGRHHRLSRRAVTLREPGLRRDGLRGGASYWDAETDDARLTLATAIDAARAGALVLTHTRVESLLREGAMVAGAGVMDRCTGERHELRAHVVVNATGPWSDRIRAMDPAEAGAATAVRGSKGAHVAVPRERIGNAGALTLLAPHDGRVFFVLPAEQLAIIGTTDTESGAVPEAVRASRADIEYLLAAANAYFPDAVLTVDDVVSAWAGVRPLAAQGRVSAAAPSGASREHAIVRGPGGLISVTGGKLTTYRAMASEVAGVVERALGGRTGRSPTVDRPLPGGDIADLAAEARAATAITGDAAIARRLTRAYGSDWRAVWSLCRAEPEGTERLAPTLPYLVGELRWAVSRELARTLGDLLIRRIPLAFELRDHGLSLAPRAAELVGPLLGWDDEQRRRELGRFEEEIEGMFGIDRD